jgi:inosine-uridine nucleoside N-ribohydrolase
MIRARPHNLRMWWRRGLAGTVAIALVIGCGGGPGPSTAPASGSPSVQGTTFAGPVRDVVIDTDMAADDWLAMLYLLGRPEVEVAAVTVTGAGEAHCDPGVRNALALVALAGKPDIPVACGRETPLEGDHAFPAEWRDRDDDLYGISIPDGTAAASSSSAVELLTTTVAGSPGQVTLLALGPLTNVAEALRQSPELARAIPMTFAMGGAVDVGGNVGVSGVGIENQFAEWNVYCDPLAAKEVLDSGLPVTLVPLDATNQAPATPAFADRLAADASTPSATFANDVLRARRPSIDAGQDFFWDPFAAAVLIDESLTTFETRGLSVEAAEGPESGRIVDAPEGKPIRFATSADLARFEQLFLDTLNGRAR